MTAILAAIAIGWIAGILLFNIGSAIAGRLFGFPVESFAIGFGPKLLAIGGVVLRLLPIGGYVRFGRRFDGAEFDQAGAVAKIVSALAGPLTLATAAVLAAGTSMLGEIFLTWPQLAGLILAPFEPLGVTDAMAPVIAERGLIGGVALTLTKFAGLNLFPLAFLAGGLALAGLLQLARGRPIGEGAMKIWLKISFAIYLALVVAIVAKLIASGP